MINMIFFSSKASSNAKINNTPGEFQILPVGAPQGLTLDPSLFNIFMNDLIFCMNKAGLQNFHSTNFLLW